MTNEHVEDDLRQALSRRDEEVPVRALCDAPATSFSARRAK